MTYKKAHYFFIAMVSCFLFISCSNENEVELSAEDNPEISLENSRVTFSDFAEFDAKINDLSNFNIDELESWIHSNNPNSLYFHLIENKVNDDYLNNLPEAYQAILSSDSEFAISDKKIWLNKGNIYEFNSSDDVELLKTRDDLKPVGSIALNFSAVDESELAERVTMGQNQLEARHQREFRGYIYRDCSNNTRYVNQIFKYVHELMTVQTNYYNIGYTSKLYLRIKLEYKAGRRWAAAGEPRKVQVNVSFSAILGFSPNGPFVGIYTGPSGSVNQTYYCVNNNLTILLKSSEVYNMQGGSSPYWTIDVSGTIKQEFNGGYYPWVNNAIW